MALVQTKLRTTTSSGTPILVSATLEYKDGRIFFVKSPYSLKDEIKAMRGSKWHGYEEENPQKIWSVEDCQRNRFQLSFLLGEEAYAWFDRPLVRHEYTRPLREHQKDLTDAGLTYHYHIFGAEMGTGKTLSAQEVIERSGVDWWFWAGPKTSLPNIKREFRIWSFPFDRFNVEFFTYEGLKPLGGRVAARPAISRWPHLRRSSRCKNASSQRSQGCQRLADMVRDKFGLEHGFVIEMSGTPSPKSPVDWWSQSEIAWPGFLREGGAKAMEERLAFLVAYDFGDGVPVRKRVGWKDDEKKCAVCGMYREEGPHELDGLIEPDAYHAYKPSKNEVAYLYERLKGLVTIKHKKDCLNLPDKRYRKIICKPTPSLCRVAASIVESAPNAVTGMTLLRELSDGFQYREEQDGMTRCTHCADGTVFQWSEPDNPEQVYSAIEALDPEIVARLVRETIPCPVCGGAKEVPKWNRVTREFRAPRRRC